MQPRAPGPLVVSGPRGAAADDPRTVRQCQRPHGVHATGFGGSVSALRLVERGYSVCVLECGRRFRDEDLPKSAWYLRDYLWSPRLGMRGILRITLFRDVAIISGAGVGGGSLVYAQTLYRTTPRFREQLDRAGRGSISISSTTWPSGCWVLSTSRCAAAVTGC